MDLTFVAGGNFSGRTAHLREWVGLPNDPSVEVSPTPHAYVGPDPVTALSGLTHTVRAEFELMARDPFSSGTGLEALEALGMRRIADQNPFTLSGGEQVVVAIVAAALARPQRLAIDCALEQLAPHTRDGLLAWIAELDGEAMIADNRLSEWHRGPVKQLPQSSTAPTVARTLPQEARRSPITIDLVDIEFKYPRGPKVFDGLSMRMSAGQSFRLKGPNGAGKTTLSKLLCGLLKPQRGEIRVDGRRVEPWRSPGKFVSYHFQNPSLQLFASTVGSQLSATSEPSIAARHLGLPEEMRTHPLDLPFVLRKRLALGTTLLRGLDFIIADEPTLGQDDEAASSISGLLEGFGGFRISHSRTFDHLDSVTL
jgi:energy-coupling factor transporter ATP-binding protein EcfA2